MKSNQRFLMIFLPEVCLEPRSKWLDFEGDTDYDPDPDISHICMKLLSEECLWRWTNPLNCGNDPDYDQDPN